MLNRILLVAPAIVLLAACASQPAATPIDVAETIARDPQLSTLNGLVMQSGLTAMLKAQGPYTVFAPTNEAFKAVPAKTMDELAHDPAKLKAVLSYHVLSAKMTSTDVKNASVKTAQGANLAIAKSGEYITVEDAMVTHADVMATNGVVHTVDRVLMPAR